MKIHNPTLTKECCVSFDEISEVHGGLRQLHGEFHLRQRTDLVQIFVDPRVFEGVLISSFFEGFSKGYSEFSKAFLGFSEVFLGRFSGGY